ncbi:M48 family metallopeptidase [Ponticoccus gilvus]|nr:M48 family metallopeptidase [Enemella evansiae]
MTEPTVIHVGAPPEPRFEALYLDGESAAPERVTLTVDRARGTLTGRGIDWPLAEIREVRDQAGADLMVLRLAGDPVRRLILRDFGLRPFLPGRLRAAPVTRRGRLMGWAVAALASVALILGVLVPTMADQLAGYIPPEGERALGEVTLTQIREAMDETGLAPVRFCTDPNGRAALRQIEERLTAGAALPVPLSVHVLDHEMINAFALPGGHIVFFRGLIEAAETPEELASVFAHEIGHVVSRDPTRHALRSAGSIGVLGLLFGDFAGGTVVLFLTERLIEARYSQDAEAAADSYAHAMLEAAGIAPAALGDMFEHLLREAGDTQGVMAHFLSHPRLGDRIARARAATPDGFQARPLLDDEGWAALKSVCGT